MTSCCPHSEAEHQVVTTCHDVIHYPSEDYPCLCTAFEPAEEQDRCIHCEHRRPSHERVRLCKPFEGAFCACRVTR